MKKIYVFLFNGYADWEISYLAPEILKNPSFEIIYFSINNDSVVSMGGLKALPALSLNDVKANDIDMLILPGGTAWDKGENSEISELVNELIFQNKPIAAICAATAFLANLSVLDSIKHTSNDINYLKAVAPNYKGESNYQNSPCVIDNNIITAGGVFPLEFSCEVFRSIGRYDESNIEKWFNLFKLGVWTY